MSDFPRYNCPACAGSLDLHFRYTKMLTCSHCDSLLFLEDESVKLRGKQSVLADYPSLFSLHDTFRYKAWSFTPIGRARFDYGKGYWDEWWVIGGNDAKWVSVDEGDIAIEKPIDIKEPINKQKLIVGNSINLFKQNLLITEHGQAQCIGVEGELPEILNLGDTFDYYHLSGQRGRLFTLELEDNNVSCFEGQWVDPFNVVKV
jgi:hypothetical protein